MRTRAMAANRSSGPPADPEVGHGAALFLSQLVAALEDGHGRSPEQKASSPVPENTHIARAAILHGQSMQNLGFTIEHVVREYGDVCQAVTEMAGEHDAQITTAELHTLRWCLDRTSARAVASWNDVRDKPLPEGKRRRELELLKLVSAALAEMRFPLDDSERAAG